MKSFRIIHVTEWHQPNVAESERMVKAQRSWAVLYESGVIPCVYSHYVRDSRSIGDPRGLPFLKDVLAHGLAHCESDDDIVAITNSDALLHPTLPTMLRMFISVYESCTAQRTEFKNGYPVGELSVEQIAAAGGRHMGRELLAASKRWLVVNMEQIPDFLLAASEWDLCLAALIRKQKGFHTTHANLSERIQCCELPFGYVSHIAHESNWMLLGQHNASNRHNHLLFKEWASRYAPAMPVPL